MEDTLDLYQRPYDPEMPVVCMDETCKQLTKETRVPLPAAPGRPLRVDYEYERNGVGDIFMFIEPLRGLREVSVTTTRTRVDWALQIKHLLDDIYPTAKKVCLLSDNLNTHRIASLYHTFPPAEAHRLARRLEMHHTPKHGSWLNVAECELSVLARQCLARRIGTEAELREITRAWADERNRAVVKVNWQFTTADARVKLKHLYPSF
jgi:hypothetical protein